ncbi:hypothetical protein BDZ45DRAFT_737774 [Acephala macrosclerotiorum]|nr:hypothetical protein BDZ45DRAFT_737774 [Acephala macrosclerotiorum]
MRFSLLFASSHCGLGRACDGSTINNGIYYLSDLQNGVVHIVNVASATEITRVGGFVGLNFISEKIDRDSSGPSGMIAVPD